VQRVDSELGKPCDLASKRSNADQAVVAQLLELDAPRDLKIEFEMSISGAAVPEMALFHCDQDGSRHCIQDASMALVAIRCPRTKSNAQVCAAEAVPAGHIDF
jgi:hypothetical protein